MAGGDSYAVAFDSLNIRLLHSIGDGNQGSLNFTDLQKRRLFHDPPVHSQACDLEDLSLPLEQTAANSPSRVTYVMLGYTIAAAGAFHKGFVQRSSVYTSPSLDVLGEGNREGRTNLRNWEKSKVSDLESLMESSGSCVYVYVYIYI